MQLTMSGYPAIADYGSAELLHNPAIPGTGGAVRALGGLRAGSVALCLLYVASRWNREVEPLRQDLGCWGYEFRTIRLGTALSNHSAGAAIDLNAVLHPQGASNTVAAGSIPAVHSIEAAVGSAIGWGGRFSGGSCDEMHWQVRDDHAGAPVDQLAQRVRAGQLANVPAELLTGGRPPDDPPPAGRPPAQVVYPFVRGDGRYFGPYSGPAASVSGSGPNDGPYRAGLAAWQSQVKARGFRPGTADGLYGPLTAAAARAVQKAAGLTQDGLIGWDTWQAAWAPGLAPKQ